jgi:hypothetical protein
VSSEADFVRHQKRQTDRAISRAYVCLSAHSLVRARFGELLDGVRTRSPAILAAPVAKGRHLGVEAIYNLARFAGSHLRSMADWAGSDAAWQGSIRCLAQHLVARYPVPGFLASAWYALDDSFAEAKRRWYVAHARGARFRSLDLPARMTRRMEHVFLGSNDDMGIEYALRRAELVGLGAAKDLREAILVSRLGTDLSHGEFWRTVLRFLVLHTRSIPNAQVSPLIDFLHSIRCERIAVETKEGTVLREPPYPRFSMKGRTPRAVLRLMEQWHRGLGLVEDGTSWGQSPLRSMVFEVPRRDPAAPPLRWEFAELRSGANLRAEGAALRHCVATYAPRCRRGTSWIWSLRRTSGPNVRAILTIEIDPQRRAIVQARGFRNRRPTGKALELLQTWAARERLRLCSM